MTHICVSSFWLFKLGSNHSDWRGSRTATLPFALLLRLHQSALPSPATGGGRALCPCGHSHCFARLLSAVHHWFKSYLNNKKRKNCITVPSFLAPQVGLEPTTLRLTAACSAERCGSHLKLASHKSL